MVLYLNKIINTAESFCGVYVSLLKSKQQQYADDQKGIADILCVIGYKKVDQYQQKDGICMKLRKLDVASKKALQ